MDLREAEDIKKRWQEYTEELYKKHLYDPCIHNGVITHLEPDILECEVKWALESITTNKSSDRDGIPVELFQILKMMLWNCWAQCASKLENSVVATGLEKVSAFPAALISHASKVMLKILQARLQHYMNCELPDVQAGFRKGRGTRDQIANIC